MEKIRRANIILNKARRDEKIRASGKTMKKTHTLHTKHNIDNEILLVIVLITAAIELN